MKSKPDMKIIIRSFKQLNNMNKEVTNLIICSNSCNELTSLDLNEYRYLNSIEIGNNCFKNVELFNIDGLNELKSLKIGMNSFTRRTGNNYFQSFHILNCIELESIEIGSFSFSDYEGGFELKNLPKLSTIKIGMIGIVSRNFYFSSFKIDDLPNLCSITFGNGAFNQSLSTVISSI